ncbi:MAG: response regulator [Erysipelotrichaceae bacterium]
MYRLLICDDEAISREGLTEYVKSIRNDIEIVGYGRDGIEAINKVINLKPQIVLMDINLPFKDGLEVIETVKETEQQVFYIIVSGYSDFNYAQKAIRLGVVDYLLKPVNRSALAKAIDNCIVQIQNNEHLSSIVAPVQMESKLNISIMKMIDECFNDPSFSLESIAKKYSFSSSYISRLIKKETGTSFNEIVNTRRLNYARELLKNDRSLSINEVSEKAGYSSQHYFSRIFKQETGLTPVEYRASDS